MNKLFNGQGNVIIKSKSSRTILEKEYEKDDVITFLEGVRITLGYNEVNQGASTGGNLLALRSDAYPSSVIIEDIKNSSALDKLLYTPSNKDIEMTLSEVFSVSEIAAEGKVYLNINTSNVVSYSKVKSYSNTGDKVEFVFDPTEASITFSDYEGYDYIRVFTTVVTDSRSLSMTKSANEYVYLELQLEGRLGIYDGHFVMNIPSAQLVSSPQYQFEEGRLQYGNQLVFTIMNADRDKPILAFVRG